MTSTNMVSWLNKELSALLECDIGDEYSKYVNIQLLFETSIIRYNIFVEL